MQTSYTFTFKAELLPGYIASIMTAFPMTLYLMAYSILFGLIIGLFLTLAQVRGGAILAKIAHGYISLMRGIPSLVLIFLLFMGLPQVAPALAKLPKSTFVLVAMTLISSANLGEMMRASYLAVEHGQTEAALSVGMTERQALTRIVLPQAVAIAVPNFGNNSFGEENRKAWIVAIIYWVICLVLQLVTTLVERASSHGRVITA